jgi:hypothetical protein
LPSESTIGTLFEEIAPLGNCVDSKILQALIRFRRDLEGVPYFTGRGITLVDGDLVLVFGGGMAAAGLLTPAPIMAIWGVPLFRGDWKVVSPFWKMRWL